jgi:hypothetical protein
MFSSNIILNGGEIVDILDEYCVEQRHYKEKVSITGNINKPCFFKALL